MDGVIWVGWIIVYPMKSKGEPHWALFLIFQHVGVPLSMVMNGSLQQTLDNFHVAQQKQTQPYSTHQNAAKRESKN